MGEFWDDWWKKGQERLKSSKELDTESRKRGVLPEVVVESGMALVVEEDWPVILGGFPGMEKWQRVITMPAFAMVADGEFGWEGLILRQTTEKVYVTARCKNPKNGPVTMGITQAVEGMWKDGWVIVVEGMWDYVALRHYTKNVVAAATDAVSPGLAAALARYTNVVGLMLDNDERGRVGNKLSMKRLELEKVQTYTVNYEGKDPGDSKKEGGLEFEKSVKKAVKEMEWCVKVGK